MATEWPKGLNLINFVKKQHIWVRQPLIMKKKKLQHTQPGWIRNTRPSKRGYTERTRMCVHFYEVQEPEKAIYGGKNQTRNVGECGGQGPARKGQENFQR